MWKSLQDQGAKSDTVSHVFLNEKRERQNSEEGSEK